jgi:hypothetical protein
LRVEFDLSASASLATPSLPTLYSVLSENELNNKLVPLKDVGDVRISENLVSPALIPIKFSVFSEKNQNNKSLPLRSSIERVVFVLVLQII